MENYILELSQEKSENVRNNGDWVSNLADKNIIIKAGDEVQLKNVFLDTVSQSDGNINIEEDLTLSIGVVHYMYSWYASTDLVYDPTTGLDIPTGYRYLKCRYATTPAYGLGADAPFQKLESIEFGYNGQGGEDWGGFTANYSYVDVHGVSQILHVNIPENNKDRTGTYTASIGMIIETNSLHLLNTADLFTYRTEVNRIKYDDVPSSTVVFTPEVDTFTFTLPAGSYNPITLASILSTKMSVNKKAGVRDDNFVTSAFLNNTDDNDGAIRYVRTDGEQIIDILNSSDGASSGKSYWSGAEQIEWSYDESVKKFKLNFFHFPIYDATNGTDISVRYFYFGGLNTNDLLTATTNSGCIIHSLTAQKPDGTYTGFWADTLGFDVGTIAPTHTSEASTAITGFPNAETPRYDLIEGENLVTGFVGLDSAVVKGAGKNWWEVPTSADVPYDSTITETNGILAEKSFQSIVLGSSHFLVELNSTFVNNFVNETAIRGNIQGIVSRYYGYDQYTSSEGQGTITYIHKGDPVYIKSIGCRILNPDLTLASLGKRNHIYLQVIKPNNPPDTKDKAIHSHQINK